ncbi:MAG: PCRF domain-containing protein, partial [Clostridia bacterium]|nr:PCRF domain-containing protein [Clostridia bacterium]
MFDKVEKLKDKFIDLEKQLSDMAVISDRKTYAKLTKEHANLQPIVAKYDEYKGVIKSLEDTLTEIDQTSDA